MKKVFQTVVDKNKGNCMQAAIASLFNKDLNDVPNFIEYVNWYEMIENYVKSEGYEFVDIFYNFKFNSLLHFKTDCFEKPKHCEEYGVSSLLNKVEGEYQYKGVDGLFYGVVCSPKNFEFNDHRYHAVLVDRFCNVVHDPNPEYKNLFQYPFADLIGNSGVVHLFVFEKIK